MICKKIRSQQLAGENFRISGIAVASCGNRFDGVKLVHNYVFRLVNYEYLQLQPLQQGIP